MPVHFGYKAREFPVSVGTRPCPFCRRETIMVKNVKKAVITVMFFPLVPVGYGKKDICFSCGNKFPGMVFTRDLSREFLAGQVP